MSRPETSFVSEVLYEGESAFSKRGQAVRVAGP
jgi:hypothetical protein